MNPPHSRPPQQRRNAHSPLTPDALQAGSSGGPARRRSRVRDTDRPGRTAVGLLVLCLIAASAWGAAGRRDRRGAQPADPAVALATQPSSASTHFAPTPPEHPLAGIWNNPEFTRFLLGSYGFLPEREPRLTAEEQAVYRDTILPLLRENPTNAIPSLEQVITPVSSALFDYTLGTIHFQEEDFATAVRHYETALGKFPDFLRAQRNLGLSLVRNGQYAEAVPALSRTLALGGVDGRILGLLAFSLVQQERFVPAAAAYQQALMFDPDNMDLQLGLLRCQVATANHGAALTLLDELLSRHPDRDTLWSLQAGVFVQQNELMKAAVNYEILRRLGKATAANLTLLGDIYMTESVPDLALSAYQEAAQLDGAANLARTLRAVDVLASRGAWDEARQLLVGVRHLAESGLAVEDELKLLRMEARVALATGAGNEAINLLERVLTRNPLDGEALLLAGDHYRQAGDIERAVFRYDAAAKIEGFESVALVKHAQLLVDRQQYTQAIELLRRAQRVDPRDNVQRYLERVEQVAARARG